MPTQNVLESCSSLHGCQPTMVPLGTKIAASLPNKFAQYSCSATADGSAPKTSSPTCNQSQQLDQLYCEISDLKPVTDAVPAALAQPRTETLLVASLVLVE